MTWQIKSSDSNSKFWWAPLFQSQSPEEEKEEQEEGSDASKSEISLVYEIALKRNLSVNFEVSEEALTKPWHSIQNPQIEILKCYGYLYTVCSIIYLLPVS